MSENIPKFVLPEKKIFDGNFIQVYADSQPFFRMGNYSCRNLLGQFLREVNLSYKTSYMAPSPRGRKYRMVGNGEIRSIGKEFIVYKSPRGGLGPNRKHLDDLMQYLPEGIKLTISKK